MALRGALDLGRVAAYFVAAGLLLLAYYIAHGIAEGLRSVPLIGGILGRLADAIEGRFGAWCKRAADDLSQHGVALLSGLVDQLGILLGVGVLLYQGTRKALSFLWSHSLPSYVADKIEQFLAKPGKAVANVEALTAKVDHWIRGEPDRIRKSAQATLASAIEYADSKFHAVFRQIPHEIAQALALAEPRIIKEIEGAIGIGPDIPGVLDKAARDAAEAAKSLAGAAADEVGQILGELTPTDAGKIIASVPLLALLVQAISTEAGLDSAECRAKVRNICGVDPAAWANLIASLATGYAILNFGEVVDGCYRLWDEIAPEVLEFIEAA